MSKAYRAKCAHNWQKTGAMLPVMFKDRAAVFYPMRCPRCGAKNAYWRKSWNAERRDWSKVVYVWGE